MASAAAPAPTTDPVALATASTTDQARARAGSGQRALGVWLGVALVLSGVLLASSDPAPRSAHVPAHIGATSAGDDVMLAAAARQAKQRQPTPPKKKTSPPTRKRTPLTRRTPPPAATVDPLVEGVLARGGSTRRRRLPNVGPAPPEVPAKPFAQCGRPRCTRPVTVLQNPVMLLYRPPSPDGSNNSTCVVDPEAADGASLLAARSPTALSPCPGPQTMAKAFGDEFKTRRCFHRGRPEEDGFGFRRQQQGRRDAEGATPEWARRRMRPNRARRGIECRCRGAVIGFAAGYEFRQLTHFPASFATVASPCDELIIIVSESKPLDLWAPHAAAADNIRIVPYEEILRQAPDPALRYNVTGLKPEGFRVLVMHTMLESYPELALTYDYIVTLDTRDLVFHADPFAFARSNAVDGLFLTREVHSYAHVDGFNFNRWWTERVLPKEAEKHIASLSFELLREDAPSIPLPVLCSGVYGGSAKAFRDFMRLFACEYAALKHDRPDALSVGGVDQGVFIATLIYTVRATAYPHHVYVLDEQAGPFRHWPYPEETLSLNAESRLVNCNATPYAVVHQADRYNNFHWATLRGFPGDRFRHSTFPACGSVVVNDDADDVRPVNFTEHAVVFPTAGGGDEQGNQSAPLPSLGMPYEWLKAPDGTSDIARVRLATSTTNNNTQDDAAAAYTCSAYSVVGAFLLPLDVALDGISLKTAERHKAIATHVGLLLRSFATLHTARCERMVLFSGSVVVTEAIERLIDGTDGPPTVPRGRPAPDTADRVRRWADVLVPRRRPSNDTAAAAAAAGQQDGMDTQGELLSWVWPLPTAKNGSGDAADTPEPALAEWLAPLLRANGTRGASRPEFVAAANAAIEHTAACAALAGTPSGTMAAVALGLGRTTGLFLRNVFAATDDAVARLPSPVRGSAGGGGVPAVSRPLMFLTFANHSSAFFAAIPPPLHALAAAAAAPAAAVVVDATRFAIASALPEHTNDDMPRGHYPAGCSSGSFEAAKAAIHRHSTAVADKKMLVRPEAGPEPMLALLLDRVGAVGYPTVLEHATYSYEPFHTPSPMSTELGRCPTSEEVLALLATTTPAPTANKNKK